MIKRKWCRRHGRVPHGPALKVQLFFGLESSFYTPIMECLRCNPPLEMTEGHRRRLMMKGFKIPQEVRAKDFIKRFNIRS